MVVFWSLPLSYTFASLMNFQLTDRTKVGRRPDESCDFISCWWPRIVNSCFEVVAHARSLKNPYGRVPLFYRPFETTKFRLPPLLRSQGSVAKYHKYIRVEWWPISAWVSSSALYPVSSCSVHILVFHCCDSLLQALTSLSSRSLSLPFEILISSLYVSRVL